MISGIYRAIRWVLTIVAILLGAYGLFVAAFLLGAFKGTFFDNPCLVAAHVEVVDELHEDNQILYLVYRVTGFHEKVAFYQLYATLPSFDACGDSKDEPLDMYEIDRDEEGKMVKDVLVRNTKKHGTRLEIRYTRQADEGVLPTQAKLIRGDSVEPNPEDKPRLWDTMDTEDAGS